jgi:hypothetical protein
MAAGLSICVNEERGDLDEVLRLRAEIAQLREERRWIPVGESLPEIEERVDVSDQRRDLIAWRTPSDWRNEDEYRITVTHWRKRTPGPEGEGAGVMDDKRKAAADLLLQAAQDFWEACNQEGKHGAVQWLEDTKGRLLIYTRGEYREQLMSQVHNLPSGDVHFFRGEVLPESTVDEVKRE